MQRAWIASRFASLRTEMRYASAALWRASRTLFCHQSRHFLNFPSFISASIRSGASGDSFSLFFDSWYNISLTRLNNKYCIHYQYISLTSLTLTIILSCTVLYSADVWHIWHMFLPKERDLWYTKIHHLHKVPHFPQGLCTWPQPPLPCGWWVVIPAFALCLY